jgi:serine/threonine-protein kinase
MDFESLGPYQITGKLGRGGMGTVYHGIHRETGEKAAIKLLSPTLAEEEGFRVRFEAEIETLRKLNHPNIVRLIGFGQQDGQLFYAMEVVEGNSLEEELRRGRPFEWREVAAMGIEICRALRHAHDRGIIHRDIKPANLLLASDGKIKLSDFGIARLFGYSRMTAVGNVVGTAEYMAPEQAVGQPVDARSDLYSLGALMYALLTRRPVFRGKSLPELLHKQRFEQPESLRKYASDVPEEFESIVNQLLEKDPARRIPNATLLGRRLEAMLHALHAGPETVAADVSWFDDDEDPTPSAELPTLLPLSEDDGIEPTIEGAARNVSITQPVNDQRTSNHQATPSGVALSQASSASIVIAPQETPGETPSPRNHFIPVDEHELDPLKEDSPKPPMFSWQTGVLAVALLLIGLTVRWFLQPPSAEALYARIADRMAEESAESQPRSPSDIDEVRKVITKFLDLYPNDAHRAEVREWEKELDRRQEQWNFEQQIRGLKNGLLPIQQMYLEAVGNVRLNPTLAMAQLQALLDLYKPSENDNGPTRLCLVLAERRLTQLRKEVEELAKSQLEMLGKRLDEADAMRADKPEQARAIYRAVIELYSDKPWAVEPVRRARKALEQIK